VSGTQRSYHSPQRDESARATRARIVTAAHSLFLEHGFASTSVADIAAASGVARPTVLTVFGTKARLLRTVVDVAMAGNDQVATNWSSRLLAKVIGSQAETLRTFPGLSHDLSQEWHDPQLVDALSAFVLQPRGAKATR